MFQVLQSLGTAAKGSPLLPAQGQGDVPSWKESRNTSTVYSLIHAPLQKPEHLYQSAIDIIRNYLGFIFNE